ncbi:sugar nucleotide-binding protein [Candidatus Pelagibacter sp.]|nr:sugar nucleotide-binding protein [Candidatus Pelagibacter sp.]
MSSSISSKKILVIGASSSIGKSLLKLDKKNKFLGTYFKNKKKKLIQFDPSKKKISEFFDLKKISVVVLLQGISKNEECIKNKKFSNFTNIELNKIMINDLIFHDIPFVFFSTEWVYSGKNKFSSERSKVSPVNLYAKQKLSVEKYILKKANKFFILRLAKTYSNILEDNSFVNNWNKILKQKKIEFKCYQDQFFSPIYSGDIYRFLIFSQRMKKYGLYNFGGSERFSRLQCLEIFLKLKKIKKYSLIKQNVPKKVPRDVSMNINKLLAANFKPSKFNHNLKKLYL